MKRSEITRDAEKVAEFVRRGRGKLARRAYLRSTPLLTTSPRPISPSANREAWFSPMVCAVCGRLGAQRHHITYESVVRRHGGDVYDVANRLGLCVDHHAAHHGRTRIVPLRLLPDSAYTFAAGLLGGPAAYEWLRRRYSGSDPRVDALLHPGGQRWDQEAAA